MREIAALASSLLGWAGELASSAHPQLLATASTVEVESGGVPGWVWAVALAMATSLINLLNSVDQWWQRRRESLKEKPEPAKTYRTLKECDLIHAAVQIRDASTRESITRIETLCTDLTGKFESLGKQITASYQSIDKSDEARSSIIHHRLNDVDKRLGVVESRAGIHHTSPPGARS